MQMRIVMLWALVYCAYSPLLHAQDAAKVDAKHYSVVTENAQVRILKVHYGAHEKSIMHSHPATVAVFLSDGKGKFTFPDGKSQEIAGKIRSLQKQGAKKIILDLRNSASGEESEGIATANLFLDHGTITYLQGQKFPKQAFNADPAKDITKLPVAVLVNRGTAGPAEIVADAILENARGDVVGDKTFGDGSVQKLIEMPDKSALILSVAKYYSPSGKAIQDAAVTPNVLVADSAEDDGGLPDEDQTTTPEVKKELKPKNQTDDQLNKALEVLKNREAKG